jgi:hypothetical protein
MAGTPHWPESEYDMLSLSFMTIGMSHISFLFRS